MSHFATLVIHKEGADIDEILAPFCETDEDFFEFYDFTDKLKKEYSTDTAKRVKMPDGKYYDCGDKIFAKEVSKEEYYKNQNGETPTQFRSYISFGGNGLDTKYILYDYIEKGGVLADVPAKEIMTLGEYAEYCGYCKCKQDENIPDEDSVFGYYFNPNAEWDWFQIGGRWNNSIKTKSGVFCNSCKIGEIDFTPDERNMKINRRFWEIVVDKEPLEEGEKKPFCFYTEEYLKKLYGDKETYSLCNSTFSTYSILTPDGEWLEPGTMGWFGISSATANEEREWYKSYQSTIKKFAEENPDYVVTLVDCHI